MESVPNYYIITYYFRLFVAFLNTFANIINMVSLANHRTSRKMNPKTTTLSKRRGRIGSEKKTLESMDNAKVTDNDTASAR